MIHLAILRQFESNTLYIYHYFNIFGNSKQIFRVTLIDINLSVHWIATNTYRRQSSIPMWNVDCCHSPSQINKYHLHRTL